MSAPNSNTGDDLNTGGLSIDESIEILSKEDDDVKPLELVEEEPKKTKELPEEEEVEEETEKKTVEEEIEEELKPPTEEDLELMTPVRRQEILKKYPQLFKDFPYLEKAYYREQQFTELFPTIPDAQEAKGKADVMDAFEGHIMQGGDLGIVLEAVKEEDPKAFARVVDNLLPSLKKIDTKAYHNVLGNVIKNTIMLMVNEARNAGENGQPLQAAAHILNQFVFGTQQFQPPKKFAGDEEQPNERETAIQKREQELNQRRFEEARDGLQDKVDNVLRATIDQNLDPKKSMTDYVRRNASKDAFEQLEKSISQDTRFRAVLDKLWERAFTKSFDKASMDAIRSAYLSKAKTLLPSVIKKARSEALRGLGRKVNEESEDSPKRGPITPGRSASPNSGKKTEIPRGMKTIDYLMQD